MFQATLLIGFCYFDKFTGTTAQEAWDKAYEAYKSYPYKAAQYWGIDVEDEAGKPVKGGYGYKDKINITRKEV
jgi:hypothetical protein